MKKGDSCESSWCTNLSLLLARLVVGGVFVYAGVTKLGMIEGVTGMLTESGFPMPGLMAWLLALGELVGGAAVILGFMTRYAAGILAFIMVVAIATVHNNLFSSPEGWQGAMAAVGFLGASLALMGSGGGKWSLCCKCKMN